jgi:hypothetical protein
MHMVQVAVFLPLSLVTRDLPTCALPLRLELRRVSTGCSLPVFGP